MLNKYKSLYSILLILYVVLIACIGNIIARHDSYVLMANYGVACVAYTFILRKMGFSETLYTHRKFTWFLFGIGILARLVLFFSLPSLSDDVYRFIWDGTLMKNGIHPFEQLPEYYTTRNLPGITQELYHQLNSPNYFTVYPPIDQCIFWLSAVIGNGQWLVSANVMRVFLVATDIGSFWFLRKILEKHGKPKRLAYWFFLNPLIILEFTGNLHFEGLVICCLLSGIYYYERGKKWSSGVSLGLAIGIKLLPYIYLPYFFFKGLRENKWSIAIIAGGVSLLTLLPLLNEYFINGMQNSLKLYFQKFEFNASIYYLIREWSYLTHHYNDITRIGPFLSIVSMGAILSISWIASLKHWSISKTMLFILSIYLALTTTVHPWYILPLVAFGILSNYFFPIIWSFLIFITYIGYTKHGYHLPLLWVILEYFITLLALVMDLAQKKIINHE